MQSRLRSRIFRSLTIVALLCGAIAAALVAIPPLHSHAAGKVKVPSLGTAASFAVLGNTTVTNTGPTTLNGNLGVSSGTGTCTGFPAPCTADAGGTVNGKIHVGDSVAAKAHTDASTAYAAAAAKPCSMPLSDPILSQTLTPGVYCSNSATMAGTTLTLDAKGKHNAVFIFQFGSFSAAATSKVVLINGARPRNVFWQVGGLAALGANTSFAGNIVAQTITVAAGATSNCGLYALTTEVTLSSNIIQKCA